MHVVKIAQGLRYSLWLAKYHTRSNWLTIWGIYWYRNRHWAKVLSASFRKGSILVKDILLYPRNAERAYSRGLWFEKYRWSRLHRTSKRSRALRLLLWPLFHPVFRKQIEIEIWKGYAIVVCAVAYHLQLPQRGLWRWLGHVQRILCWERASGHWGMRTL